MIGKRFRSLPFIFANDNYTLRRKEVEALYQEKGLCDCQNCKY